MNSPLLKSYSLLGLCKYFLLKLRRKELYLQGVCLQCGSCCRSITLQGPKGWFRDESELQKSLQKFPEYSRFEISGRDHSGYLLFTCSRLTVDNFCCNYGDRLALCKRYPDKTLYFMGIGLPAGCGYHFTVACSFRKILLQKMRK